MEIKVYNKEEFLVKLDELIKKIKSAEQEYFDTKEFAVHLYCRMEVDNQDVNDIDLEKIKKEDIFNEMYKVVSYNNINLTPSYITISYGSDFIDDSDYDGIIFETSNTSDFVSLVEELRARKITDIYGDAE